MLVGNSDGHSKNLSLLFGKDQRIRLAPLYDLICTNAIQGLDNRLAMSVGEKKNPDLITTDDWKKLAQELTNQVGDDILRETIKNAEAGQFSPKSWSYWHYRLRLAEVDKVLPLPTRRFHE